MFDAVIFGFSLVCLPEHPSLHKGTVFVVVFWCKQSNLSVSKGEERGRRVGMQYAGTSVNDMADVSSFELPSVTS